MRRQVSQSPRDTPIFRLLQLEPLEDRICPAGFEYVGLQVGYHVWRGTAQADFLASMFCSSATIHYQDQLGTWDSGVPCPSSQPGPTIKIWIDGLGGDDVVNLFNGSTGNPNNLMGMPIESISELVFWAGAGNDEFNPPQAYAPQPGGGLKGAVILPAPGAEPNIKFYGDNGNDTLQNGNDPEGFLGGNDTDYALVPAGRGGGDDVYYGGGSRDFLHGGIGNDAISGGDGVDDLYGDDGNDVINGGLDEDRIWGGSGNDRIDTGTSPAGGGVSDPDDLSDPNQWAEVVYGGDGNDVILATKAGGPAKLNGGNDDDRIEGSQFDDRILAGDGKDVVSAHVGNDDVDGGNGTDYLWGGGDQPWRDNGVGNPFWFNMDQSGPDTDAECDIEDGNLDLDGQPCVPTMVVAVNDSFSVFHNNSILHTAPGAPNVLANDSANPIPVIQVTHPPLHGIVAMYADGTFNYFPDPGFVGTDDFYYELVGALGASAWPARVTINVINRPPVASPDGPISVSEGTPKVFNILTGAGSPNPIPDNDADGDEIDVDVSSIVGPTKGTISVDAETGQVTYTYTGPNLNPGSYTSDSFTYKAKDDWDSSIEAKTVQLMITGMPLVLDRPPVEPSRDTRSITDADLALLADEAARRWVAAGVDPVTAQRALEGTTFIVDDLPGSILGLEFPGTIVIDVNAAGYGWFVDATPSLDEEFNIVVAASERQAGRRSPAFGRVDLLTALEHELGHALGMDHPDSDAFAHSVMHETLSLSTRRIPTAADILAADEFYASLGDGGSLIRRKW